MLRIAGECLPRFVFIENVPALLKYRGRLEQNFARIGYRLTWAKVAAQHVEGCPHRRLRVFVLAELGGRHQGVCDAGPLPPLQAWPTPTVSTGAQTTFEPTPGQTGGNSLPGVVRAPQQWPTPRATDDKDGRGKRSNRSAEAIAKAGATLPESVRPQVWPQMGGRLNPEFVEALQGLPVGYTSTDGPPMRKRALRLMANPRWPAPMVKSMWGDSPQHCWEPARTVPKSWGAKGERAARLRALGNCNPPAQYALALALIAQGPRQKGLFA